MVSVSEVALVVPVPLPPGLNAHCDSLGRPEQVYVSGSDVDELEPLVTTNPVVLVMDKVTALVVCPGVTVSVPVALLASVKVWVVAVTVRLTLAFSDTPPEVPVTVTAVVAAAIFASVLIVSCEVKLFALLTDVGTKVQVAPVGRPEQVKE